MLRSTFMKYFAVVCASGCFVYFLLEVSDKHTNTRIPFKEDRLGIINTKYVLLWTPFDFEFDKGRSEFIINDCQYTNCYITDNKDYFVDHTQFDAVLFDGIHMNHMEDCDLPTTRSTKQKYIFFTTKPTSVCNQIFDGYFNWTWTYRLDSDIQFKLYTISDSKGFVGPDKDIIWKQNLSVNNNIKVELKGKNKDVAWIVSDCVTTSRREKLAEKISGELSSNNRSLDVYGACGRRCGTKCRERIGGYHFYLSFEDILAEDYVTDVITALEARAVPVVYGASNYSRFLPPGSYLDGRKLNFKQLAKTIVTSIQNKTIYYEFHKWRTNYDVKETKNKNICNLCAALNDSTVKVKTNKRFRQWWNGNDNKCNKFKPSTRCL